MTSIPFVITNLARLLANPEGGRGAYAPADQTFTSRNGSTPPRTQVPAGLRGRRMMGSKRPLSTPFGTLGTNAFKAAINEAAGQAALAEMEETLRQGLEQPDPIPLPEPASMEINPKQGLLGLGLAMLLNSIDRESLPGSQFAQNYVSGARQAGLEETQRREDDYERRVRQQGVDEQGRLRGLQIEAGISENRANRSFDLADEYRRAEQDLIETEREAELKAERDDLTTTERNFNTLSARYSTVKDPEAVRQLGRLIRPYAKKLYGEEAWVDYAPSDEEIEKRAGSIERDNLKTALGEAQSVLKQYEKYGVIPESRIPDIEIQLAGIAKNWNIDRKLLGPIPTEKTLKLQISERKHQEWSDKLKWTKEAFRKSMAARWASIEVSRQLAEQAIARGDVLEYNALTGRFTAELRAYENAIEGSTEVKERERELKGLENQIKAFSSKKRLEPTESEILIKAKARRDQLQGELSAIRSEMGAGSVPTAPTEVPPASGAPTPPWKSNPLFEEAQAAIKSGAPPAAVRKRYESEAKKRGMKDWGWPGGR